MDKEVRRLMNRLMNAQQGGNEAKIQDTANDLKTYLRAIEKKISSLTPTEDSELVAADEPDCIETIASNYYEVIKFVLKRMRVKKFDEIRFALSKDQYLEVSIIKDGKEYPLDFDAYVHHNDEQETEYLMEIEALSADNPELDWNSVIDLISKKDWSKYCS